MCFKLACLPHRGCSLLEVEGSLSQRQKLTAEVSALAEEEQKLEQLIQRCSQDMRHMSDSASNQKYPFFCLQPTLHPEDSNDSRLPLDLWTPVYVNKTTLMLAIVFCFSDVFRAAACVNKLLLCCQQKTSVYTLCVLVSKHTECVFFNPSAFHICLCDLPRHQASGKPQRSDCDCRQSTHGDQTRSSRPRRGTCAHPRWR